MYSASSGGILLKLLVTGITARGAVKYLKKKTVDLEMRFKFLTKETSKITNINL